MKSLRCASMAALLLFAHGCSLAAKGYTDVTITASHEGAELVVDGEPVGKAPQHLRLSNRHSHTVIARCGNSAGSGAFGKRLSGAGIADIVGAATFLLPAVGLASAGAYTLEPTTLSIAIPDASQCAAAE
ncbi:MAG TPA: hypothetical protein VGK20_16370 [Candidatus Binatia bacterium]|jgi:hypothetical protein